MGLLKIDTHHNAAAPEPPIKSNMTVTTTHTQQQR